MKSIQHRSRRIAGTAAILCALLLPIIVLVRSVTAPDMSTDAVLLVSLCSTLLLACGMAIIRGARGRGARAQTNGEQPVQSSELGEIPDTGIAQQINNPNHTIRANASLLSAAWQEIGPILEEYHDENGDFLIAGMSYEEIRTLMPVYLENLLAASRRIETVVGSLPGGSSRGDGTR